MTKQAFVVLFLFLFAGQDAVALAQGTLEDYERSREIGRRYREAFNPLRLNYQWFQDGILLFKGTAKEPTYLYIDGISGERQELADLEELDGVGDVGMLEPQPQLGPSGRSSLRVQMTFENTFDRPVRLFWSDTDGDLHSFGSVAAGERKTLSTYQGHQWIVDFVANDLAGIFVASWRDCRAILNEESRRIAMEQSNSEAIATAVKPARKLRIVDHNLHLDGDDDSIRLTEDGTRENGYRRRIHYSPDGRYALAFRETSVEQRRVPLIESAPRAQVQPKLQWMNYRKPGDELPQRIPTLVDLEAGKRIAIDESKFQDAWSVQFKRWSNDGQFAYLLYNRRGHQQLTLRAIEAKTGEIIDIVDETSDTFVDYSQKTMLHWLDQSDQLLWASERDGWNHLYRIDARTGAVLNQVTHGDWLVRDIELVDEEKQEIWFTAMGVYPDQDPYHRHLARVRFDGSEFTLLTEADGTHNWEFNHDRSLFVDRYSRVDQPEIAELRRSTDGSLICELGKDDASELVAAGFQMPIRFAAPGRDGKTMIYGFIVRPSHFDPKRSYPVIEHIYAGPHDFHVPKRFGLQTRVRQIAELGFVVVQIDGMGTNWRSKAFHDKCWQNLMDGGLPDRIAWMKAAAQRYAWMDLSRVGIYGGSAGGQNALAAVLNHGEFYKAATADCGCHDNRMDKIWWNEAWMGEMGAHYVANSNVTHAHKLTGDLLLTVGELDRNVDPASTMQVVDALIKADRDFQMLVVPGAGHGIGEGSYLFRRRQDFFVRSLLGVEPRR